MGDLLYLVSIALVGTLSIATLYVNPAAIGLLQPAAASLPAALPEMTVPAFAFPTLAVPKLHAATKAAPLQAVPAATLHAAKHATQKSVPATHRVKVPVVTSTWSVAPPSPKTTAAKPAKDPFAKVPVVTQTSGAPQPTITDPSTTAGDPSLPTVGTGAPAATPDF